MSILPNFLITGILSVILGLVIIVWSTTFVQRKHGGLILILLSVALLLFGGGFFPPVIGIVGGADRMRINKPVEQKQAIGPRRTAATLWYLPPVVFLIWVLGQFPIGYFSMTF